MKRKLQATTPNRLLNELAAFLQTKNDAALARKLKMSHASMTRIRGGSNDVSANIILRIYDLTGWTIEYIRQRAGMSVLTGGDSHVFSNGGNRRGADSYRSQSPQ